MTWAEWAYVALIAIPTVWGFWHTVRWLREDGFDDPWLLPDDWDDPTAEWESR